jgi:hypothetical protein
LFPNLRSFPWLNSTSRMRYDIKKMGHSELRHNSRFLWFIPVCSCLSVNPRSSRLCRLQRVSKQARGRFIEAKQMSKQDNCLDFRRIVESLWFGKIFGNLFWSNLTKSSGDCFCFFALQVPQ